MTCVRERVREKESGDGRKEDRIMHGDRDVSQHRQKEINKYYAFRVLMKCL